MWPKKDGESTCRLSHVKWRAPAQFSLRPNPLPVAERYLSSTQPRRPLAYQFFRSLERQRSRRPDPQNRQSGVRKANVTNPPLFQTTDPPVPGSKVKLASFFCFPLGCVGEKIMGALFATELGRTNRVAVWR